MILREFYYVYKSLSQSNFSIEKKKMLQLMFMKNIVTHAYNNFRFYTDFYNRGGFNPSMLNTLSDISKIPILKRSMIKEDLAIKEKKGYKLSYTSGTTGSPLTVYFDEESMDYNNAIFFRSLIKEGYNPFSKLGFYWYRKEENSVAHKLGILRKVRIYPKDSPAEQYKIIKKNKVKYLYYFPFKLYELSTHYSSEDLKRLKIRKIFTIGEVLSSNMKKHLEEVFGCKVIDNYGLTEFNIAAHQTKNSLDYSLNYDNCLIEAIDCDESNLKKGIITSFSNYVMPLIRYDTEDYIEYDNRKQTIKKVLGKKRNFIDIGKNKYLHVSELIDEMVSFSNHIYLFRFRLEKKSLVIEIDNKTSLTEDIEKKIIKNTAKKLKNKYNIKIEKNKKFNFDVHGKLDFFKIS